MRNQRSLKHLLGWGMLAGALVVCGPVWGQQQLAMLPASPSPNLPSASITTAISPSPRLTPAYVPGFQPAKKAGIVEAVPSRRPWLLLSAVGHGAAAFDAYSTRQAVEAGAVEANPFMKPFAQSDAIYPALQTSPLLLDFVGRRLQRSHNPLVRHLWWVPQSVGTAASVWAGMHNLQVAAHP
jgi:hypothetical protein